jgi:hypothetical protein
MVKPVGKKDLGKGHSETRLRKTIDLAEGRSRSFPLVFPSYTLLRHFASLRIQPLLSESGITRHQSMSLPGQSVYHHPPFFEQ